MKLTLQDLQDSFSALLRLARQQPTPQQMTQRQQAQTPAPMLPAKVNYKLGKIFYDAKRDYATLSEQEIELIKKYGGTETAPDYWTLPRAEAEDSPEVRAEKTAQHKAFNAERAELLQTETEVWAGSQKLSFEEMENAGLTPEEYAVLHWMIQEPVEDAPAPQAEGAQAAAVGA